MSSDQADPLGSDEGEAEFFGNDPREDRRRRALTIWVLVGMCLIADKFVQGMCPPGTF
jgi:hypothetical protein